MGKTLYLECNSGISGDMTAAALLDLGADQNKLEKVLASLPVSGFETKITRVVKAGLDVCDFDVVLDAEHENHDHDMEYLHGHDHPHDHDHEHHHDHDHDHDHHHDHDHDHDHHHDHEHHHHHEHRGLAEVMAILDAAQMSDRARSTAKKIFDVLADAEAKAHGTTREQVHFHEVGAVDSIVDIVAIAVCLDDLDVENVIVPYLCEGSGTIRCAHGILPVPVPAVSNIVAAGGLNLKMTGIQGELVTPTGAATVAAICTGDTLPEKFSVEKIGMGAGKRQYERPSILRAMLIQPKDNRGDSIVKLESNIDDCSGEALGYCMEQLLAAGARDVHYTPVYMKKNRPAWQLNVICSPQDVERLEDIIFAQTTTIGIRRVEMVRSVLDRKILYASTPAGKIKVKVCSGRGVEKVYPEYDAVAEAAKMTGFPFAQVFSWAQNGELSED